MWTHAKRIKRGDFFLRRLWADSTDEGERAMQGHVLHATGHTVLHNHSLPSPATPHSSSGIRVSKQYSPSTACRSLCSWKQL